MMHGDTAARMTPQAFQALIDEALTFEALGHSGDMDVKTIMTGLALALKEVLGLDRYAIRRTPHNPGPAYLVIE